MHDGNSGQTDFRLSLCEVRVIGSRLYILVFT